MYHETNEAPQRDDRSVLTTLVAALVLAIALTLLAISLGHTVTREQGAQALRQSVLRASMQCCAIEGSYPTSIAHLCEHYGLVINERDYLVAYEWLGDNIVPSVVVTARW